jgi:hypothetical protein
MKLNCQSDIARNCRVAAGERLDVQHSRLNACVQRRREPVVRGGATSVIVIIMSVALA